MNQLKFSYTKLIFIGVLYFITPKTSSQSIIPDWKYQTGSEIIASPVSDKKNIYIGNENGDFMAIEKNTGKLVWKVSTKGNIQAKALLVDDNVFFESGNIFYLLNRVSGKEIWNYDPKITIEKHEVNGKEFLYKLDAYDDKRSSGYLDNDIIYIGLSNGELIGIHSKTGNKAFSIKTDNNAPIRSTPTVYKNYLYFGDWNGIIYCFNLISKTEVWKKKTFDERIYPSFGPIVSEFVVHDNNLYFGARNPEMDVLSANTGISKWSYTEPNGGWIIGDPVIQNDILYIGGSDNFSMLAFDTESGKLLWENKKSKNIYTKAIVTKKWIIYTAGNGYDFYDTGEVVLLDKISGEEIDHYEISNGVFSSPLITEGKFILFGSIDGNVYSLEIKSE